MRTYMHVRALGRLAPAHNLMKPTDLKTGHGKSANLEKPFLNREPRVLNRSLYYFIFENSLHTPDLESGFPSTFFHKIAQLTVYVICGPF
jgi:hypothetical protein